MTPFEAHELIQAHVDENAPAIGLGEPSSIRIPDPNEGGIPPGNYEKIDGVWTLVEESA